MRGVITCLVFILTSFVVKAQNCSVNAGVGGSYCLSDTIFLSGSKGGLFSGGTTWNQISGPSVTIVSPNALISQVTGFTSGVYRFSISANCQDGTKTKDEVTFTVLNSTIANAGPDINICPSVSVLAGNRPAAGESGKWTIRGANLASISILNDTLYNSGINASYNNGGSTVLRWTITNVNGCTTYDDIIITNFGGSFFVDASADDTLDGCYTTTTSTTLSGTFCGIGLGGQSGTWTAISGPNIPFISNPNFYRTTVSGLVQGTYVFVYNVTGPCISGTDTVSFYVPPPVGTLSPVTATSLYFCDRPTSVVLSGVRPIFVNDTCRWRQIFGPSTVTINPINSPSTTVSNLIAKGGNIYIFRYYMENPITGCKDSVQATINYIDTPFIQATPDRVLPCDQDSVNITYNDTGGRFYNHSLISGPYTGLVRTQYSRMVNFSNMLYPGNYIFRISRQSGTGAGCVNSDDDVRVIVSKTPSFSNAGSDQLLNCDTDTTEIAGSIPTVGFGQWSQLIGPNESEIKDSSMNVTTVSRLIAGQYQYRWLINGGQACTPRQDDVTVFVSDSLPTAVDAGPDRTLCYGGYLFLNGNQPDSNEFGRWRVIPDSGIVFSDSTAYNSSVSGLQKSHQYTFIWRIFNGCGQGEDTVVITTDSLLGPKPSLAGMDRCLPDTTTRFRLNGNTPWDGTGKWTKLSGPSNTIEDDTVYNTLVTNVTEGHYAYEWRISRGTCEDSKDTIRISISKPTSAAYAGRDIDTCSRNVVMNATSPLVGEARWRLFIGSGGGNMISPDSANTPILNLNGGTYVFRWTVTNGACPSNSDDVIVNISEPATVPVAAPGRVWCNPGSIFINANRLQYGKGYWSMYGLNPNSPTFASSDSANTIVSNLMSGIYHFRWNAIPAFGKCPSMYSDRNDTIVLPANAGPDEIFCNVYSATLTGTIGSRGYWTKYSGGTATVDTTGLSTAIATNLNSIGSPYKFVYSIDSSYGCPGGSDTVQISISDTAKRAFAGIDANYCNKDTFFLNANSVLPDTGTWTVVNGPSGGNFSDINAPNAYYLNAPNGTFLFQWTSKRQTCTNSDVVLIRNFDSSAAAFAGNDTAVCPPAISLNAAASTNASAAWQQLSGPNTAIINSLINPKTPISNLIKGTYKFIWAINNGYCPSSSDTVTIDVPFANPTPANAGMDTVLCNADSMMLNGNSPLIGTGLWTQLSGAAINFGDDTLYNTRIYALNEGIRDIKYTIQNGNCFSYDTVRIEVNVSPSIARTDNDSQYCLYVPISISANPPDTGTGHWTLQRGAGAIITLPDSATTTISGLNAGTYVFRWTVSSGVCNAQVDSITISVDSIPTLSDAGPDITTCLEFAQMAGNRPTTGIGTWTILSGKNTPNLLEPNADTCRITGLDSGAYQLQWEIAKGGCRSADTMFIRMPDPQPNDQCDSAYMVNESGAMIYYGDMCGAKTFGSEPNAYGYAACNTLFYKFHTLAPNFLKTLDINILSMSNCYNGLRISLFDSAACPGLGTQFDTTIIVQSTGYYNFDSLAHDKTYILVIDENRNPCTKTLCQLSFVLSGTALPIELLSFDAVKTGSHSVKVNWQIINNGEYTGYEVWCDDGQSNRLIQTIYHPQANGSPAYFEVMDDLAYKFPATYILKGIDRMGQKDVLAHRTLDVFMGSNAFVIYPNPADRVLTIDVKQPQIKNIVIEVSNATGQIVFQDNANVVNGSVIINSETWPDGLYTLRIIEKSRVYNYKIVVMH